MIRRLGGPGMHGVGGIPLAARCPSAPKWWDPLGGNLCVWAAYQPKGAADLASSYLDLSGNGNSTGPGVAPAWDAVNGWTFDGGTQYLVTTFTPQVDQSQSMVVQFTNAADNQTLCGSYNPAAGFLIQNFATNVVYHNGASVFVLPVLLSGNLCVAGSFGYRNGVLDAVGIANLWTAPFAVYIGALNLAGAPAQFSQASIQALAIYDCILDGPTVALIAAAMAAL